MFKPISKIIRASPVLASSLLWALLPVFSIADGQPPLESLFAAESLGAFESCDEPFQPISAKGAPNYAYFAKFVTKSDGDVSLKDLLVTWYGPRREVPATEDLFARCLVGDWGKFRKNEKDQLPADCTPDVLYSWGPRVKVDTIAGAAPDGELWSGPMNPTRSSLFSTPGAIATFMYGEIPIRLKLRPETTIVVNSNRYANPISNDQWGAGGTGDFCVNRAEVVESWSFATPEHYDEIVRDALRVASGKPGVTYIEPPTGEGLSRLSSFRGWDSHDSSARALTSALFRMVQSILREEGRIYFAKGTCRSRAEHFRPRKPSYLNP